MTWEQGANGFLLEANRADWIEDASLKRGKPLCLWGRINDLVG